MLVLPQIPAEAAEQFACVKKQNGQFRLVESPEDCNPSEFSVVIEIEDEGALSGELCWTNSSGECTLRLRFNKEGTLYSMFGNESCTVEEVTTVKNVYGSGHENGEALTMGLTYTGLNGNGGPAISHEGKVFVLDDPDTGLGLAQQMVSEDEEACDPEPAPCIIEEPYEPVECP